MAEDSEEAPAPLPSPQELMAEVRKILRDPAVAVGVLHMVFVQLEACHGIDEARKMWAAVSLPKKRDRKAVLDARFRRFVQDALDHGVSEQDLARWIKNSDQQGARLLFGLNPGNVEVDSIALRIKRVMVSAPTKLANFVGRQRK